MLWASTICDVTLATAASLISGPMFTPASKP
ncbi:Uncharacterised protein [Vibrio cholerae]|nr:Uncharacterised protein [Vibrio cholerae]